MRNIIKTIIITGLLTFGLSSTLLAAKSDDPWRSSYIYESKGEYEKAAALLTPMLDKGAYQEYATLRYAWLHYLQGNYNDAIRSYKKALTRNARSFDARLGVSLPLMAQGRWKEAAGYLKQVIGQSPYHYTAHSRLMTAEEGMRKWSTLEQHAKSIAAYYPSDTTTLVYLARAYVWQDKADEARKAYAEILIRFPDHIEANHYLKEPNQ